MAENDAGEVRGFALWFLNYSTWEGVHGIYLEDLYVTPEARGEGHGKALLQHLAATAVERGYARVEWSVLDWNEPSINFYRKLGRIPDGGMVHLPAHRRRPGSVREPRSPGRAPVAEAPWTLSMLPVHTVRARHEFRGMRTAEHYFTVPLDHFAAAGADAAETITVFAREYVSAEHSEAAAAAAAVAPVPAGRTRRPRQPVHRPGRLEQGGREGFPDPHAGPARHRAVLPHRPQHAAGARATPLPRPAT